MICRFPEGCHGVLRNPSSVVLDVWSAELLFDVGSGPQVSGAEIL